MNSLSWMIYAAEVVGRVGPTLMFGGGCFMLLGLFLFLPASDDLLSFSSCRKILFAGIVALFIGLFVPSASTVYMVAASEAGEQVIKTPEAREMFTALKGRIMEELKVKSE